MSDFEDRVRAAVTQVVDAHLSDSGAPAGRPAASVAPLEAQGVERRIAVGADHGGYLLKDKVAAFLSDKGWQVTDCGTSSGEAVDYPEQAYQVATKVTSGVCRWGIVVDGAGIGSAMAANKVPGIRAALAYDISSARNSREHNHANVLTLGAGLVGPSLALQIVDAWLSTPWGPGRHARRVELIDDIERRFSRSADGG